MENSAIIAAINTSIWDYGLIYLLIGSSLWFTIRGRFVQFRLFPLATRLLFHSRATGEDQSKGISTFQALCTSLASHVGTSNLAGVAIAISLGGPGAIFWMWIMALLGMATAFVENTMAQVFKTRNPDGSFRGGPAYYIEKALGQRWLGIIFSLCLISAFGFSFNAVQSNSVSAALHEAFSFSPELTGLGLVMIASLIIFRGVQGIARFAEKIVPFMAVAYVGAALIITAIHIEQLPDIALLVFRSAFGLEHAAAGGAGYLMSQAIAHGIRRGLFSNEAGMGSGPNLHAIATPYPNHPVTQGLVSMFSVFFDTIVICTSTAAIILVSGVSYSPDQTTGIVLTQNALAESMGIFGKPFIALITLLFGFTSIVANTYYGESSLRFIHNSEAAVRVYRLLVLGMVFWGAVGSLPLVWALADITMAVMAIINLGAILILSKYAFLLLEHFEQGIQRGTNPTFNSNDFPELKRLLDRDVWSSGAGDKQLSTNR
ncbi:alanine/glycine:cation symporter family protein [Parendozoicomonas haliclonae]|uniref:Amino-acid carrier protein AlsT n=1 Tax=Parendozoicomonas haliclonae TaxID=1960125 RepID=A0A1X7AMK2_9GAMM|nr:sodium:alanine symporter family protein [Parendozoicomonas haliclonae]SMA49489.1 Amino-acid carrier protein AlsT [Parendozoicomonas haliclonae]